MITKIVLENFKCFRKIEVKPRLVTVFVGPNGTGKSSVLQALALLKQSVGRGALEFYGDFYSDVVDLQDHKSVAPNFELGISPLRIAFGGRHGIPDWESQGIGGVSFSYEVELPYDGRYSHGGAVRFTYDRKQYSFTFPRGASEKQDLTLPGAQMQLEAPNRIGVSATQSGGRSQNDSLYHSVGKHVLEAPARVLESLTLVPASRGLTRTRYHLGSESELQSTQETHSANQLSQARPSEEQISSWLRRVTGVGFMAHHVGAALVEFLSAIPSGNVNVVVEGHGTNVLIFLLFKLADAPTGATVMIEEPEIHLHPRSQAELASLLAEVAKAENKQLIITTHSEHILGRLLTLVAEKKLVADELAIYAFEKDEEGVCTASQLEVTEDGRVTGGIKDFFESELAELDRYIKALQSSG